MLCILIFLFIMKYIRSFFILSFYVCYLSSSFWLLSLFSLIFLVSLFVSSLPRRFPPILILLVCLSLYLLGSSFLLSRILFSSLELNHPWTTTPSSRFIRVFSCPASNLLDLVSARTAINIYHILIDCSLHCDHVRPYKLTHVCKIHTHTHSHKPELQYTLKNISNTFIHFILQY